MKTIVLLFSNENPITSEKTLFIESIKNGVKKTTIRRRLTKWEYIEDEVNEGKAFISLRYWSDTPYRSKQVEFARCYRINVESIFMTRDDGLQITVGDKYLDSIEILDFVENEGFGYGPDGICKFLNWFNGLEKDFSGALIEFKELDFEVN